MGKRLSEKIHFAISNICGFFVVVAICIASYAVLSRFVLELPVAWSDEVLSGIFIWLIFICAALSYKENGLIGLDLVEEKLSSKPKAQKALKIIQNLFALLFGGYCTWQAYVIIAMQLTTGESTPIIAMPLWFKNFGFFIGSGLICIFALQKLYQNIKAMKEA